MKSATELQKNEHLAHAEKIAVALPNITESEKPIVASIIAINEVQALSVEMNRFTKTLTDGSPFSPLLTHLRDNQQTKINASIYKNALDKINDYIEKGGDRTIIENLPTKFDNWGIALSEPLKHALKDKSIKVYCDHLKEVTDKTTITSPKEINIHLHNNKQTETLLKQYGVKLDQLDKTTREYLKSAVNAHNKAEEATRSQQSMIEKQSCFNMHFDNSSQFFNCVGLIGKFVHDKNLITIGSVGVQGIAIAKQVATLTGFAPGIAAATGLGMLLPIANIAFAATSLLSSFSKKDQQQETLKEIKVILENISKNIATLRQEIHERFDVVDKQLRNILQSMDIQFLHLKTVMQADIYLFRESTISYFKELIEEMHYQQKLLEDSTLSIRLDKYTEIKNDIDNYIYNSSLIHLPEVENKLLITCATLEKNWLINNFCDPVFNRSRHYDLNSTQSYSQMNKIAAYAAKKPGANLGYLAKVAQKILNIDIQTILIEKLPHVALWSDALKNNLSLRTYLIQKYQKTGSAENLKTIKDINLNALNLIKVLQINSATLFYNIIQIYKTGLVIAEAEIKKIVSQKLAAHLSTSYSYSGQINIRTIAPNDSSCPILNSSKLLNLSFQVPMALIEAQKRGLGKFSAFYSASKILGRAYHGDGGNWHYPTYRQDNGSTYQIYLYFNKLNIFNASFQKSSSTSCIRTTQGKSDTFNDRQEVDNYRSKKANEAISSLVNRQFTESVCISTQKTQAMATCSVQMIPKVFEHAWNNYKTNNDPILLTNALKQVGEISQIAQMQAAAQLLFAYATLIGISRSVIEELQKTLIISVSQLLANPSLFNSLPVTLEKLLKKMSSAEKSIDQLNLEYNLNLIQVFEEIVSQHPLLHTDYTGQIEGAYIDPAQLSLGKRIGEGGFANVYEGAWVNKPESKIALKQLKKELDSKSLQCFQNEVETLTRIKSENIIEILGYTILDKKNYIIMELAGDSLYKILSNKEKLSRSEIITFSYQIARGLADLHKAKIIHGDIKSPNILKGKDNQLKITDFGMAQVSNEEIYEQSTSSTIRSMHTNKYDSSVQEIRSPLWCAPEHLEGDDELSTNFEISDKADVYSFGVVLWELLTGERPFEHQMIKEGKKLRQIEDIVIKGNRLIYQPLTNKHDLPKLEEIIIQCWKQDPTERPTMQEIVTQLEKTFSDLLTSSAKITEVKSISLSHQNILPVMIMNTKGAGDCAFHSIFGELINSQYESKRVDTLRKELGKAVRECKKGDAIHTSVKEGIQALIMESEREGENKINQLRKNYQKYLKSDLKKYDKTWESLDDEITAEVIDEYALFIEKCGTWLLPSEIKLIALVFNVTVTLHLGDNNKNIFNPGQTNSVEIRFNGRDHYERLVPNPHYYVKSDSSSLAKTSMFASAKMDKPNTEHNSSTASLGK